MSPNNKKKLAIIRKKLDLLDNRFLQLIKIRTKLVKEVLKLKEFKKSTLGRCIIEKSYNFLIFSKEF